MSMTEIVEDMEVVSAARILQDYCHKHKCTDCTFSKDSQCPLKTVPAFWNIKKFEKISY